MARLPASHVDLLDRPLPAVLTTEMPDGRLQSTVVWCCRDGDAVLLNTMREFQKARNLRARPRATVLVVEPGDATRWIEVRGGITLEDDGAAAHLDALSTMYVGASRYFGEVVPAELAATEHPIRVRLTPTSVRTGPMYVLGGRSLGERRPAVPSPRRACTGEPRLAPTHRDLLERPLVAALSTRMPSGAAQTQPVWFELDGNDLLVNTTRERRKGRNLAADPRGTFLVVDPDDSSRWIEIRGDVDLLDEGAEAHLDRLTRRYTGARHYYGTIYPVEQRAHETRVIGRVHPRHIVYDAIHRGRPERGRGADRCQERNSSRNEGLRSTTSPSTAVPSVWRGTGATSTGRSTRSARSWMCSSPHVVTRPRPGGSSRFFQQAITTTHVTPTEVVTETAATYPIVLDELLPATWHRTEQDANNHIECDHGRVKRDCDRCAGSSRTEPPGAGESAVAVAFDGLALAV